MAIELKLWLTAGFGSNPGFPIFRQTHMGYSWGDFDEVDLHAQLFRSWGYDEAKPVIYWFIHLVHIIRVGRFSPPEPQ